MHGCPRDLTWTELSETAEAGDTEISLVEITVAGVNFDWAIGEEIVIASTDYDAHHAETRIIRGVEYTEGSNPKLSFDEPLEYKHYSGSKDYDGDVLEMRAEVGLLSRNIKFTGGEESLER